jgi:enolase
MFIESGVARIIKDSRGENTIEISIKCQHGSFVASAPAGKSKGKNEVIDYNQRGIAWSAKLANNFFEKLRNKNIALKNLDDLKEIENRIKQFESDFGILGGNVVYAIETALMKSAAKECRKELWRFVFDSMKYKDIKMPMPVGNCIGGGLHSRGVNGKMPDFQEFELIPDEEKFSRAVTKNIHAYLYAKKLLKRQHGKFFMKKNDENAWETSLTNEQVLDVLREVANKYGLRIGLDVAASGFCDEKGYYQYKNKSLIRDTIEQIDYMRILIEKYNLFYVEDPLKEEDFSGFEELSSKIKNKKTLIVGDDLTTTNLHRLERAARAKAINAIIVKPNQIGSFVEVKKVIEFCKKQNIKIIFSHRSGETMDSALADFAVGFQADFIKTGIWGKERMIKLRRIIEIEKDCEGRLK